MTEEKQITPWVGAIKAARRRFLTMADEETWERESSFAMQAVLKNDYLIKIANQCPESLRFAVSNIAAIGLTLNPAMKLAYLVPRDNAACLDISYIGLLKLGTDSGAIKWGQAENVYSNDSFVYHGPTMHPDHDFDPFLPIDERGTFKGSYCEVKTDDGDRLITAMSAEAIYDIRDKSDMFKKKGVGPWKDFFGEMAKKTVIKRASKTWPKSTGGRLEKAIEMLNDSGEGIQFEQQNTEVHDTYTIEQKERYQELVGGQDPLGMALFCTSIPRSVSIDLYNSGEKGQKVKLKQRVDGLTAQGIEIVEAIKEACSRMDENGLLELIEGTPKDLLEHLPAYLGMEHSKEYLELTEIIEAE